MVEERVEKALEMHKMGRNCAQCVACAFSDKLNLSENDMLRALEGFGGGMGGLEATCGAVSGAVMAMGLRQRDDDDAADTYTRGNAGPMAKTIVSGFKEKNGSIVCRELKGIGTGKVLRSCDGCIEDAVRLAAKIIEPD